MTVLATVAFWYPGTLALPGDDGKPEIIKFRARYKRLKKSERKALDARIEANKLNKDLRAVFRARLDDKNEEIAPLMRDHLESVLAAKPISDAEFLREVLCDLEFSDRQGERVPYSLNAVTEIDEELDGFEAAVVGAYFNAKRAADNAKDVEKNSETLSGTTSK